MTDVAAASTMPVSWDTIAQNNPVSAQVEIAELTEEFGPENVGNAGKQFFMISFGDTMKDMVNDSDLPQPVKDMTNAAIDARVAAVIENSPCCAECLDAVGNTEFGADASQAGADAASALDPASVASGETTADVSEPASEAPAVTEEQQEAIDEAKENEQPAPVITPPAEGGGESGGGGGISAGDAKMDEITAESGVPKGDEDEEGGGSGNTSWLDVLAGSLAQIQAKFLDTAMEHSRTMANEADNAAGGGDDGVRSGAFLEAQSKYTANIQMFSIFSQQVSTSVKSIGEALNAISRKQ